MIVVWSYKRCRAEAHYTCVVVYRTRCYVCVCACICAAVTGIQCNNPQFQTRSDTTAVGASSPPLTFANTQQCLDYCATTITCVGVDVDYNKNPVNCWVHTNANDYAAANLYTQVGTNSYQLITRCASSSSSSSSTGNV